MKFCPQCGSELKGSGIFCPECGSNIKSSSAEQTKNLENKREIISASGKSNNSKMIFNAVLLFLFAGSIFYYFATTHTKEEEIILAQPKVISEIEYLDTRFDMATAEVKVEDGNIILSLDEVLDKKFVRFVYKSSLREIPMLAYISEDGNLVTSISMCEPCNSTTFHIKGDELVCNSCGSTWELNSLKEVSGSCGKYPPDPIPSKISGNKILISESDVQSWRRRV